MLCFRCDNETEFEVREVEIEQEYRNSTVVITTPLTICKCCGWQSMDTGQADELCKRTKAAFAKLFCQ
jgi:hypothetical protein